MGRIRRTTLGSLAALLSVSVFSAGATAQEADAGVGFGDNGQWRGSLSYNALVVYDDEVGAQYYGRGTFQTSVSAASVEGSFVFDQATITRPTDLPEAFATAQVSGLLTGAALQPELVYDEIFVTSTSSGVTAEFTFTAAELGNPRISLVPTTGSCGSISGFWNQEFAAGLNAQGEFIAGRQGTWVAHRVGVEVSSGVEYETVIASIEADAAVLIEALREGGPWSADIVGDVLARAEQLAVNGLRRANCDPETDDTAFRSRAFATVAQLLEEAALSDGVFADGILELMIAGYRSGVFAADPELRAFYDGTFELIVDNAMADGSETELVTLFTAAVQLARTDLAQQISDLLAEGEGS
ncbi:MAG: hypothetical protein ACI9MX_000821 [Candidatus Aldehydirespiratoraceae bacterium]|jgi:hypothetical protein